MNYGGFSLYLYCSEGEKFPPRTVKQIRYDKRGNKNIL